MVLLLLKIRYIVFVIYSKKLTITQKLMKLKKITYPNHDKYITTPEFKTFTAEIFALRLKQANLASNVVILISLKRQILIIN